MPIEETSGFCAYCQKPVLGRRDGINHVAYILLTIFTCGLWGIVWVLQVAFGRGEYACPTCGGVVTVS